MRKEIFSARWGKTQSTNEYPNPVERPNSPLEFDGLIGPETLQIVDSFFWYGEDAILDLGWRASSAPS